MATATEKFHRGTPVSAISVRQPYAWLIVCGFKMIENRSRPTRFRGRVGIHASRSADNMAPELLDEMLDIDSDNNVLWDASLVKESETHRVFSAGSLIGSVELYDCVHIDDLDTSTLENKFGVDQASFASGPYCYLLRNAKRYRQPIRMSGKVSIPFSLPDKIIKSVGEHESRLIRDPMKPSMIASG